MTANAKRYLTLGIFASAVTQGCASMDTEISPAVGALHAISITSKDDVSDIKPMKFSIKDGATTVQAKSYLLHATNEDASYIALHFSNFDLPVDCTMEISDAQGTSESITILKNKGRNGKGKFWAKHIKDSSLMMTIRCIGDNRAVLDAPTFQIDKYAAGYPHSFQYFHELPTAEPTSGPTSSPTNGPTSSPTSPPTQDPTAAPTSGPTSGLTTSPDLQTPGLHSSRTELYNVKVNEARPHGRNRRRRRRTRKLGICNGDDRRQGVTCSLSGVEEQSRGVARLLIDGRFVCSGFLVSDNLLVTTSLCLDNADQALDVDYEFQFQASSCHSKTLARSEIFEALEVVENNETSDFVIIRLAGNPGAKYGYFLVSDEVPSVEEAVYLPQHKQGWDKQVAENCVISTNGRRESDRTCSLGGSFKDIQHSCDVDGGALGSPVISQASGLVVGMHHCGGTCPSNFAIPGMEIHNALKQIPQIRSIELEKVTSEAQCLVSINHHECAAVINSSGIVRESCECANFCGGEFLGCCEKGEECAISCSAKLVAGCDYKPPSLSHQHLVETHLRMDENVQAPEPWYISEESATTTTELPSYRTESYENDSMGKDYHRSLRIR